VNRRAELSGTRRSAGRRTARSSSLHRRVSPWIRAALVRDAGRLGLRGQRDARSMREKLSEKSLSLLTATIPGASIYA
jgi:uncharacterized protein (DUF2336 family)